MYLEDERPWRLVVGEPVAELLDERGAAAHVEDVREVRGVVAGPVQLLLEHVGDVIGLHMAGQLLEHPEHVAVVQRTAWLEVLVVHHHPLVVVRPAVVPDRKSMDFEVKVAIVCS